MLQNVGDVTCVPRAHAHRVPPLRNEYVVVWSRVQFAGFVFLVGVVSKVFSEHLLFPLVCSRFLLKRVCSSTYVYSVRVHVFGLFVLRALKSCLSVFHRKSFGGFVHVVRIVVIQSMQFVEVLTLSLRCRFVLQRR